MYFYIIDIEYFRNVVKKLNVIFIIIWERKGDREEIEG